MISNLFLDTLKKNHFLIMSHRGLWGGNIIENSIASAQLAYQAGADIVEVDVCRTDDGVYYLFHDGNEPKLLNRRENFKQLSAAEVEASPVYNSIGSVSGHKINTLVEFLRWLPEGKLVNIDRSWDYWDDKKFFRILEESGKRAQLVLKSPVEPAYLDLFSKNGASYLYIPIVKEKAGFELVQTYKDIQMVGLEIVVSDLNSDLLDSDWVEGLKKEGLFTVANAENLGERFNLFGGLNDDTVLFEEVEWEAFILLGVDVIQTDWPYFLQQYRETYKPVGECE